MTAVEQVEAMVVALWPAGGRARAGGGLAAVRDAGRDPAGRARGATARPPWPGMVHAAAGPVRRAALRHVRLQRRARHRRRSTRPRPPGGRPRQGGDAGRGGRHRACGCRRLDQRAAGRLHRDVRAAWELHARLVRRSLERGFYQGWDLHPAQLPTRYAATYAFFREPALPARAARLRRLPGRQRGGVLDEPATARALAGFLLRGLDCGALDPSEIGFDRATLEAR